MITFKNSNSILRWIVFCCVGMFLVQVKAESLCQIQASDLQELIRSVSLQRDKVEFKTTEILISGQILGDIHCLQSLEVRVSVDQASARTLDNRPRVGDVLFAKARVEKNKFMITLTGQEAILEKLQTKWKENGNFEPFMKSQVLLRFLTHYKSNFELARRSDLIVLAEMPACRFPAASKMFCEEFKDLSYQPVPKCLQDETLRHRFVESLTTLDPYILENEWGVEVRSVNKNLCFFRQSTDPWIVGAAKDILLSVPNLGEFIQTSSLSAISFPREIQW